MFIIDLVNVEWGSGGRYMVFLVSFVIGVREGVVFGGGDIVVGSGVVKVGRVLEVVCVFLGFFIVVVLVIFLVDKVWIYVWDLKVNGKGRLL